MLWARFKVQGPKPARGIETEELEHLAEGKMFFLPRKTTCEVAEEEGRGCFSWGDSLPLPLVPLTLSLPRER